MDSAGNLFIADSYNYRIRKVTVGGTISTIAGNGTNGYSGDGGPAIGASLNYLILQDINHRFFWQLVANGEAPDPATRGQRRLTAAYADIKRHVQALRTNGNGVEVIQHWLMKTG